MLVSTRFQKKKKKKGKESNIDNEYYNKPEKWKVLS